MPCSFIVQVNHAGCLPTFLEKLFYPWGKSHALQLFRKESIFILHCVIILWGVRYVYSGTHKLLCLILLQKYEE